MIKYFTKLLGIDRMPRWLLIHLMVFSMALGGIQAILFIVAFSGFIEAKLFGYYPEAIALSGIVGILLFNLYKILKNNFSYRKALIIYFSVVALIMLVLLFIPLFIETVTPEILYFIVFFPFACMNQMIVVEICNNVTFQRYQQNLKRYTETLYLSGAAVFSAGIVVAAKIGLEKMVVLPVLFLIAIVVYEASYVLKKVEIKREKTEEEIDSVITLFSDIPLKFTLLVIFGFLVISGLNYVLINYLFIDKLSVAFVRISSVVMFLGMYYAGLMAITMLFKTFVYQNLIKTFRLNKALMVSSVFMAGAMLILNFSLFIAGNNHWNLQSENFFIIIVFAGFFNFLLRESFEVSSLRLILSTISSYSKRLISGNLQVLFVLWSFLFSGLVLLLVMSFELFTNRFLIYINSALVVTWLFVSYWLLKKYGYILERIIENLSNYTSNGTKKSLKERVMLTTNLSGLKYLLNYQRYYQPFDFQKNIDDIPATLQDKLGFSEPIFNPADYSTKLHEPTRYRKSESTSINFYDSDVSLKLTDIEALASSAKIKDRIRAIKMIENSNNFAYAGIFKMLIRDTDEEVRRNALLVAVRYYNNEILSEIIKYINHEEFSTLISEVLIRIGDDAIPQLNLLFHRVETDFKVQILVIRIMGRIASTQAINFLLEKLVYPNKWVVKEAIAALNDGNVKIPESAAEQLEQAVFKIVGTLAWLLSKEVSLNKIRKNDPLVKALDDEYNFSLHLLFDLLYLQYRNGVISYINENLESVKNNEQFEIQVELLGKIVNTDIKLRLFALLHNNQKSEKIEQLKQFYPIQLTSVEQAIKDMVNADYEYISTWTKACALKYYITHFENLELQDIIAHLFNPDMLISELVLFFIYKQKPELVAQISDRIPYPLRSRILNIIKKGDQCEYSLLFNKVINIQKVSYFQNIMGHYLVPFAEIIHDIHLQNSETTFLKCTDEEILPIFFTPNGDIGLLDVQKRQMRLNRNFMYGLGLYAGGIQLTAYANSVLYVAQPEQIGYLVIHFEELSEALFKYTQNSNFD